MHEVSFINSIISDMPFITHANGFIDVGGIITGNIQVSFEELNEPLDFEVNIFPQYPLKTHASESISFINKDLIKYDHVMSGGSICIHTSHHTDLKEKLIIDFNSLKAWIEKYYINHESDQNYEHIIVSESLIDNTYISFTFTDVNYQFNKESFGRVKLSQLNTGSYKEKNIDNFLVQSFSTINDEFIDCKWSDYYKGLKQSNDGIYYFLEDPPAKYNRFIFDQWDDFSGFLSTDFLEFIHTYDFKGLRYLPLFFGYNTVDGEIHWQVAILDKDNIPLKKRYVKEGFLELPRLDLIGNNINWVISRNSSYSYFFGRGTLCSSITESKVLILGVGAVGSTIAKSLVRSGLKNICIVDYDIKEYENICRSEYIFQSGISDKVSELGHLLSMTSPFIEVQRITNDEYFETVIKVLHNENNAKEDFKTTLNEYDIVFDCTTDNDLMYILNSLDLDCDVINLSITNHAKELVCAFSPNIYHFVNSQFTEVLKNDLDDLYEPTGCWSPTFKASYIDINVLVQFAIKQINSLYESGNKKNNFVLKTDTEGSFNISLKEY